MEKATFGAGCFWGVEDAFRQVSGVIATTVGYMGGQVPHPTYREVCSGLTGHTEVVEVTYNPALVTFEQLLEIFLEIHNPTLQQKAQYKSVIFIHDSGQRERAVAALERYGRSLESPRPVLTQVLPAAVFYPAEEYHQHYYQKTGRRSCHGGGE